MSDSGKTSKRKDMLVGISLPLLLLAVWFATTDGQTMVTPPQVVAKTILQSITSGYILRNLWISFYRVLAGFLIGSMLGFLVGTLMALSKRAEKIIAPLFNAFRNVPVLAWLPVLIIWFGFGDLSEIVFLSIGAFSPVVVSSFEGIHGVSLNFYEVGKVFGFSGFKLFFKIVLPCAMPQIFSGLRTSLSAAWMLIVVAEMFGASVGGIGNMMNDGREFFQMDIVIMGIIAIGITGFLMNAALSMIEKPLLGWRFFETKQR